MSISVLKIMESVNSRNTKRIVSYINDGLSEIADLIPDKIDRSTIDVVSGTRLYNFPSNMKKLLGVYAVLDSDADKYGKISRIQGIDLLQDDSTNTVTTDDDLIII